MKRKLQVFVSSTYTDLVEERQAAVAAILKAGHIPAGMELFTSGDKSQMKTIEKWIEESDVYMLILGGRYGSIENTSGLSYTELEYDYAVSLGKRLFSVVITEETLEQKIKSGGSSYMEKENPKQLSQFRDKVLQKMCSFFADTKDVRLSVYDSLLDIVDDPSLVGWVSAAEIEDTKSLHEELRQLRQENATLQENMRKAEDAARAREKSSGDVDAELIKVLRAIEVNIPANLAGGKERSSDLFAIAYRNRDTLIAGVTNRHDASDAETFFYFNILPKLQAHGLADNEKLAGVRYRRGFLNKAGQALFAGVEKRAVLAKAERAEGEKTAREAASVAPAQELGASAQEPDAPAKRPRAKRAAPKLD